MQTIAHAGCDGQYTANTLSALKRSAPHIDAIEIDLRRCGSGEIVLFHDETLDRAVGIDRRLDEMALDTLQELTVSELGERIPTLRDALEVVPPEVGLNLEFKETGLAADAERVTSEYDHDLLISSFCDQAIEAVLERDWSVRVGSLFETDPIEHTMEAKAIGCDAVHPHVELCLETDVVSVAQELGLAVNAWTIESKETVRTLRSNGVDGVIVNRWDLV